MTIYPSSIKGLADNENHIWKKPIRISDKMMVVAIPESIIHKLEIDEDTLFELVPTRGEIILRISSKKVGSPHT